jgi:hypothetical protein
MESRSGQGSLSISNVPLISATSSHRSPEMTGPYFKTCIIVQHVSCPLCINLSCTNSDSPRSRFPSSDSPRLPLCRLLSLLDLSLKMHDLSRKSASELK